MDQNGQRYAFDVTDIKVTADGQPADVTVSQGRWATTLSIPAATAREIVIKYNVMGATMKTAQDRVDLLWQVVGKLGIDVTKVTGTVGVPVGAVNYACQVGVPGALLNCSTYTAGLHGQSDLNFSQNALPAGQVLQVQITFPAAAMTATENVTPVWTVGRALSPGLNQLGAMLGVLAVGVLAMWAVWRRARTAGYQGIPLEVARFDADENDMHVFVPDADVRPGLIGTLVDSRVDPADILATILDLAVRGHLLITEIETSRYATPDWLLTRQECDDPLKPYEAALLDAMTATEVRVSSLSECVMPVVGELQSEMYDEVLAAGWFSRLPSKRSPHVIWAWVGIGLAVAALAVLMALTTYGLAGLALVAVAVIGLGVADRLPHVTPKGAAVYAGLQTLGQELATHSETDIALDERYAQISRILPYAVVLGSWDRWLAAMKASDTDAAEDSETLPWYHALPGWQISEDFPASMDAFITVVTGELFTRA